jgi:hypothetical protein
MFTTIYQSSTFNLESHVLVGCIVQLMTSMYTLIRVRFQVPSPSRPRPNSSHSAVLSFDIWHFELPVSVDFSSQVSEHAYLLLL